MNRTKEYIAALMDSIQPNKLTSDEQRVTFGRIRDRINNSLNLKEDLQLLYRVINFYNFALVLMYIAEEVEKDPTKSVFTSEEQTLVIWNFIHAMGGAPSDEMQQAGIAPESRVTTSDGEGEVESLPIQVSDTTPEELTLARFGANLEQFVEAMQQGEETRDALLEQISSETLLISEMAKDQLGGIEECSELIKIFLEYIRDNDLLDDVRVMNILSNLSAPAQAFQSESREEQETAVKEAIEILRDFRSLFE